MASPYPTFRPLTLSRNEIPHWNFPVGDFLLTENHKPDTELQRKTKNKFKPASFKPASWILNSSVTEYLCGEKTLI